MSITIPILTDFDGKGVQKAVQEFKNLETTGQKAQFAIKKAAVPAAAALAGLGVAAVDFAKAAAEDEAGAAKLANQLKNSTGATDKQIASVEKWISKTSIAKAITDDELRPALATLARNTKDMSRAQDLLNIAMDVSAATGKDLNSVTVALGKAENGQYTALKKLGIPLGDTTMQLAELSKEQKKLAKLQLDAENAEAILASATGDHKKESEALTKAQSKLAAQQIIVNELTASAGDYTTDLTKVFKGAADTAANTAEGGFKKMQIALQESKESIGTALLPVVSKMATAFAEFGTWAQDHSDVILALGAAIGTIAAAIVATNVAMTAYNALKTATVAVNAALSTSFTALQVATGAAVIVALVAAFVVLQKKFDIVGKSVEALKTAVSFLWEDVFKPFGEFIGKGINIYFDALSAEFTAISDVVERVAGAIKTAFKVAFNFVADVWNNTVGKLNFKIPGWVPGIGGKEFGVPEIPKFAEGGIVTGPTVGLIGEAGPEAIIPLNRAGGMMGNNVTINVNGGDPQAVVQALRTYMRQNGSVPIRVSNIY